MNRTTRRIPSAIPIYLAAAVWILGGLTLPLYMMRYILLCIGASAAVYWVGVRFFPGREVVEEHIPLTGDAELDRQIAGGIADLKALRKANDDIPSPTVSARLDRMAAAGEKIFAEIAREKGKAPAVRKFMNYYLPTAVKLMDHYRNLSAAAGGEQVAASLSR
ncbi:MAG: hypothetical protein GX558_09520, partial [Clostridiales bacterium]|nr:hypothetical protein [Clostridiales bacterium]